jgi:hypothetical protein
MGQSTPEADARAAAIGIPTGGVAALGFGIANKLVGPFLGKMLGDTIGKYATLSVQGGTAMGAQSLVTGEAENLLGAEKKSQVEILSKMAESIVMGGVLGPAAGLAHVFGLHTKFIEGFKKLVDVQGNNTAAYETLFGGQAASKIAQTSPPTEINPKPKDVNLVLPPMTSQQAEQTATDILGQAAHVVMDKIEQHVNMTPDELSRVQTTPAATQPPRPNVLDRSSIPNKLDAEFPSIGSEPMTHEQVSEMSRTNEYVKLEPLNLQVKTKIDPKTGEEVLDAKSTTTDLRYRYTGGRGKSLLDIRNLATDIGTKGGDEDQANFWGRNYPKEELQKIVVNPEKYLADKAKSSFERLNPGEKFVLDKEEMAANLKELNKHLPDIEKAINPSEYAQEAMDMHARFIKENGEVAQALGTINEVRENYFTNRLYKPDPPDKRVRIEGKTGIKTFSFHKLQRIYEDPIEAIANGKRLASTKLSELTSILGQDTIMVNYGRQLVDEASKTDTPLLKWFAKGSTPKDWKEYDGMTKEYAYKDKNGDLQIARQVAASPKEIYQGMRPLVEPDWWRAKVPGMAAIQDIQAYIKTGWLGMSVYHDMTFAAQTLSSIGGAKTLADLPKALFDKTMETPAWRERESIGVRYGLTTPAMSEVIDIRTKLEEKGENWDKFLKTHVVKQVNDLTEAHTKFLFGPYQRWIKVETFSKEMGNWTAKHPNASEDQITEAGRGIARATNDTFGGRNWEALGFTKTQVSMLRTFLLAPDWVTSMIGFTQSSLKGVVGRGGAEGVMTRGNLYKTLAFGYALGNGMNALVSGHPMWDNPKGHKMEVQIAPDVYFSPFRGMVGEMVKLYSDMYDEGLLQGAQRYLTGKASPFTGTVAMAYTGESPTGGSIWKGDNKLEQEVNGVWALIAHNLPIPIGASGLLNYNTREENKTPAGEAAVSIGFGRFSKPSAARETSNMHESVIQAYKNGNEDYVKGLIDKGDLSEEEADKLREESTKSDLERKTEHMKIDKMIELYNHSSKEDRQQIRDQLEDKFDRYMGSSASPNAKKKVQKLYDDMGKE